MVRERERRVTAITLAANLLLYSLVLDGALAKDSSEMVQNFRMSNANWRCAVFAQLQNSNGGSQQSDAYEDHFLNGRAGFTELFNMYDGLAILDKVLFEEAVYADGIRKETLGLFKSAQRQNEVVDFRIGYLWSEYSNNFPFMAAIEHDAVQFISDEPAAAARLYKTENCDIVRSVQ